LKNHLTYRAYGEKGLQMLRKREQRTADHFGITNLIEALKADLLAIQGVTSVEFDLDGFWDDLCQVIILTGFDITRRSGNYFSDRGQIIESVVSAAAAHGLTRTGDLIEDYGAHLYFVFSCDKRWEIKHPV